MYLKPDMAAKPSGDQQYHPSTYMAKVGGRPSVEWNYTHTLVGLLVGLCMTEHYSVYSADSLKPTQ